VDTITGGAGFDVIMGGALGDTITAELGGKIIVGDNGVALLAGLTRDVYSSDFDKGGVDHIIGGGDGLGNVIIGGTAGDDIRAGSGADVILGDSGYIRRDYDGSTVRLVRVDTVAPDDSGDDRIQGGDGFDVVLGGSGADDIDAGTDGSRDVVVGDNGLALFDANEVLVEIRTAVPDTGGDDNIVVGDGDDFVLGGIGSDYINVDRLTGQAIGIDSGKDVIIGDNGYALFDANDGASLLREIQTSDPQYGDRDVIFASDGADVVLGGSGADDIDAGTDGSRDIVIGDNGQAFFNAIEVLVEIRTSDPSYGGDDGIRTGNGSDVVLGGDANDLILASGADSVSVASGLMAAGRYGELDPGDSARDIVMGDNGEAFFTEAGILVQIRSTDFIWGGDDRIITGNGSDVVIQCARYRHRRRRPRHVREHRAVRSG
jgi:Ca2+-binding RTX toxin-like protein